MSAQYVAHDLKIYCVLQCWRLYIDCRNLTFVINVAPFSTGKYNSWMEWTNLNESMSQCSKA